MAKLRAIRVTLITLQLISLTVATIIILVHYNPWIERMIDEAERSGNTGQSLADQIQRIEGEEIAIFFLSSATILVSVIGIIGTLRGHEHNHCLLNFYMSTLIIFLFVIFMALCGTLWEMISKLQLASSGSGGLPVTHSQVISLSSAPTANPFDSAYDLVDEGGPFRLSNGTGAQPKPPVNQTPAHGSRPLPNKPLTSWLYLGKSLLFITLSAALYTASLRLTRKILESSDDRYLSASEDGDEDDLNSEGSLGNGTAPTGIVVGGVLHPQYIVGYRSHTPYSNHSYNNFHSNIAGAYANNILNGKGAPPTGAAGGVAAPGGPQPASPFRNV